MPAFGGDLPENTRDIREPQVFGSASRQEDCRGRQKDNAAFCSQEGSVSVVSWSRGDASPPVPRLQGL